MLFWSPSCLKSSGRLLGIISTKSRPNPSPGVRVVSCYLMILNFLGSLFLVIGLWASEFLIFDLKFGFLVNEAEITRTPGIGFGRDLVEIVPRSLPELFKQLGDQNHSQKHKKASDNILSEK